MADSPASEHLPARRDVRDVEVRTGTEDLTPCPSCGRLTATVGRGTCVECWWAKTPAGEAAVRPVEPKTLPLLGSIAGAPDWIWFALASAQGGLGVAAAFLL
jgi:hypothetical protein